jgi:hypothetical protein
MNVNIEKLSRNHCYCRKAKSVSYSECGSVALVIQHAMRKRHIVLPSVACPAVQYFPHYLTNGTLLGGKLQNIKCVCFGCLYWTVCSISHSKKNSARYCHKGTQSTCKCTQSTCEVPAILDRFSLNSEYLDRFSRKKFSYIPFHEYLREMILFWS